MGNRCERQKIARGLAKKVRKNTGSVALAKRKPVEN
jgi:hypothetical protein